MSHFNVTLNEEDDLSTDSMDTPNDKPNSNLESKPAKYDPEDLWAFGLRKKPSDPPPPPLPQNSSRFLLSRVSKYSDNDYKSLWNHERECSNSSCNNTCMVDTQGTHYYCEMHMNCGREVIDKMCPGCLNTYVN